MGARTYIPVLGRFTSVDPIQGGVENNYVYPPDPVNDFDLTGTISWRTIGVGTIAVAAGVGVAACVVATAGICGGAAATIVVSGGIGSVGGAGAYATRNAGTKEFSYKYMGVAAGLSGAGSATIAGGGLAASARWGATLRQFTAQRHLAHHFWKNANTGVKQWRKHIELRTWNPRVKGSHKKLQIPYGKRYASPKR